MDFKQIEAFINVAKHKSFSRAANNAFLSQPTVSAHISSLEKELNVQLFDRTSKEVILTSAGESFLEYAISIINTRNNAISHLSSYNDNLSGKFTLAASTTPCNSIIPCLIEKFSSLYPQISFNILELSSGEIIENILKFNCEIGIIGSYINDYRLNCYKIMEDELLLISNPSLNIPDTISAKSLIKYKFILRDINSGTRKNFEKALSDIDIDIESLNVCCEVNNLDTLFQFVKSGIGVSIVSKHVCGDYVKTGNIKTSIVSDLDLKRYVYLITSSRRTLTPTAKAFFDLCNNEYHFKIK